MTPAAIAALRARFPDHPWFAPGGIHGPPGPAAASPPAPAPGPAPPLDRLTAAILANACGSREASCHCLAKPGLCHRHGSPTWASLARCRACPAMARIAAGEGD